MIARASGLGMGVGRISRPLKGVAVLAIPDARLDTMRLVVPSVAGGVCIDCCYVADGVQVTH